MKTFPARLMNKLFHSHAFRFGIFFPRGARTMETGGGAALATATTEQIDIPSLANNDAVSGGGGGGGGGPPHTFDERAVIEIGWAYDAFGSGPLGGRTGAPPIPWMLIALRRRRQGAVAVCVCVCWLPVTDELL